MLVFAVAKAAMLAGHSVSATLWAPLAYCWQDAAVALLFAAMELRLAPHRRVVWGLYALAGGYAAINIPVARAVSTPLTRPMWHAARGPLASSIFYYATWQNALLLAAVAAVALLVPRVFDRLPRRSVLAALAGWVALGPFAAARVDTAGLDRNAWTALISPSLPDAAGGWRTAGFERAEHPDLSRFRGGAAGRNIIFVSLESTAAQYLGLYGASPDPMPNLSRLAGNSIVFENAYAVYPESIKGLFSILCSMYPAFGSSAEAYEAVPCRSVAAELSSAGYRTALFHSGRFAYLGMEGVIRGRGFATLEDAGDIGGNRQSSFGVDEPSTVARILGWIDGLPHGARFFAAYLPIAGHHPYETPDGGPFPHYDDFGRYRNALHYGDASLGILMDGLRSRGLEQKTVWVIVGDHGEAFGQHDGNYGHTFQLYEENVHVPFLIAAPGLIPDPLRDRRTVSLIDTAPTILALAGLPIPESYQGRPVFDPAPRMALFFADYSLGLLGLRDGPRKFIDDLHSGRLRLFDLRTDPGEREDLAAQYRDQVHWYARNLQSWSTAQRRLTAAASHARR
jgi:hypothetical protein